MSDQTDKPAGADQTAPRSSLPYTFSALHNDINQLFHRLKDGLTSQAPTSTTHASWLDSGFPSVIADVTEGAQAFRIAVELPGVGPDDVELSITGDTLTLKGEKREEVEEKGKTIHLFERSYGEFQRVFHLPNGIDRDRISANFDKGVLAIILPKAPAGAAEQTKTYIPIG
jgi:HSP20 family protein